jgi:hypothetical protein
MCVRAADYLHKNDDDGERIMKRLFLAAACILGATSAAAAQAGFNPGTVVSNVYETLAVYGCGSGFGFSPAGCNYVRPAPGYVGASEGPRRRIEKGADNGSSAGPLR